MDTQNMVTVREVGLRDGLQSIARTMPTAHKLEWLRAAYAAGEREIEVGSFVPARLLPQLADTADVVAEAKTLPGLVVSVLVPNLKGAGRAIAAGAPPRLWRRTNRRSGASRYHSVQYLVGRRKSAGKGIP